MPRSLTSVLPSPDRNDALASSFATTYAGVVAFMAVVHEGSFARAAERLGIGRSAVSRSVLKLETQLDTRLFLRTTRSTSLTAEGQRFFEGCRPGVDRIFQALDEMRELRTGIPRGHLRISSTVGFGRKIVAPLLKDFHARYPDITLDLILDDRPTDFTSDRIDVAFRNGRMDDSQIVAKKLVPMPMLVCASPAYAQRHGLPRTPDELAGHGCVNFRFASGRLFDWEFKVDGAVRKHTPQGWLCFNDADLVHIDTSDLFPAHTTWIGFRRGGLLRKYQLDFIQLFAPHLTRRVIERAAGAAAQADVDQLVAELELPLK